MSSKNESQTDTLDQDVSMDVVEGSNEHVTTAMVASIKAIEKADKDSGKALDMLAAAIGKAGYNHTVLISPVILKKSGEMKYSDSTCPSMEFYQEICDAIGNTLPRGAHRNMYFMDKGDPKLKKADKADPKASVRHSVYTDKNAAAIKYEVARRVSQIQSTLQKRIERAAQEEALQTATDEWNGIVKQYNKEVAQWEKNGADPETRPEWPSDQKPEILKRDASHATEPHVLLFNDIEAAQQHVLKCKEWAKSTEHRDYDNAVLTEIGLAVTNLKKLINKL